MSDENDNREKNTRIIRGAARTALLATLVTGTATSLIHKGYVAQSEDTTPDNKMVEPSTQPTTQPDENQQLRAQISTLKNEKKWGEFVDAAGATVATGLMSAMGYIRGRRHEITEREEEKKQKRNSARRGL